MSEERRRRPDADASRFFLGHRPGLAYFQNQSGTLWLPPGLAYFHFQSETLWLLPGLPRLGGGVLGWRSFGGRNEGVLGELSIAKRPQKVKPFEQWEPSRQPPQGHPARGESGRNDPFVLEQLLRFKKDTQPQTPTQYLPFHWDMPTESERHRSMCPERAQEPERLSCGPERSSRGL